MRVKVSVIIVTWNSHDEILACLDSFIHFASDDYEYELIIVDNNSDDNTVEVVRNQKYAFCKVYQLNKNTGFARGNNYGLERSSGQYVLLLNPDTILTEDVISNMIQNLKSTVGVVGCKLLNEDMTLQVSAFNFETPFNLLIDNLRLPKILPKIVNEKLFPNYSAMNKSKKVDWLIGAVLLLRAEDIKEVGGLSEEYFMYTEDMDLCKKVNEYMGKETYYTSEVSIIHLGGRSESKNYNYNKSERLIANKIMFLEKFYGTRTAYLGIMSLYLSYSIKTVIAFIVSKFKSSKDSIILYEAMNHIRFFTAQQLKVLRDRSTRRIAR